MIVFRTKGKKYCGYSALEVVRALEKDTRNYPHRGKSVRRFLRWSLAHLDNYIHPREMDVSARIEDEALALNYLILRDEYGAGKLSINQRRSRPEKLREIFQL